MPTNKIGMSYYGKESQFQNPVGITSGIPSGSSLSSNRHAPWLSPPFDISAKFNKGEISYAALKEIYRQLVAIDLEQFRCTIDALFDRFGNGIVLLGCQKNPSKCHRSILAEFINEHTEHQAVEVSEQHQLIEVDYAQIIADNPL
ncbi:DUF488 family protein [Oceanidesulfovibrio indonesiensis]|nr:DUF488 family protein [Oceanidesulfovibrio indonesiensis]